MHRPGTIVENLFDFLVSLDLGNIRWVRWVKWIG